MTFEDGLLFEPTAWAYSDDLSKQKEFDSAVGRCHAVLLAVGLARVLRLYTVEPLSPIVGVE
jgi:hypothetical protein